MRLTLRPAIPCALLAAALIAPAGAAAVEPVEVVPPFSSAGDAGTARIDAAAVESGCRSRNRILFREAASLEYEVRPFGDIECASETPLKRVTCFTTLFKDEGGSLNQISRDTGAGTDRCRAGSPFRGRHAAGERFVEKYGYNLTLRRNFRWQQADGTYCHRTNEQRTLVCRDQHSTLAPNDHVETHNSSD